MYDAPAGDGISSACPTACTTCGIASLHLSHWNVSDDRDPPPQAYAWASR